MDNCYYLAVYAAAEQWLHRIKTGPGLYAELFTFLSMRHCIVLAVLVPNALMNSAPWPKGRGRIMHVAFAGLLLHALYLIGCVWSLRLVLPVGLLSLIVSMQPLLTAGFAGVALGERVRPEQSAGLALGFISTVLVVAVLGVWLARR